MIVSKTVPTLWVGIDVSKKSLDAAIWFGGKKYKTRKGENNGTGLAELLGWATELAEGAEIRFALESTGDYHTEAALFFTEEGHHVSVLNPARVKYFGIELGRLTKTDKADAKLIAQYSTERSPAASPLKDESMRRLLRLYRRRQQIVQLTSMEECRRECPKAIGEFCMGSIKTLLKALRAELRRVEKEIASIIASHAKLKGDADLLDSIPRLGPISIMAILAEMPPVDEVESAAAYAAAAGVQSTSRQSGEKQTESARMSKTGRRGVRKVMFMPTRQAIRVIPELQDLFDRLRARGRKYFQAVIACMRKLLMIVYGVLKHRKPFKSRFVTPVAT